MKNNNSQTTLQLKAMVVSTDGKEKAEIEMSETVQSRDDAELFWD